jgi:hypothetical protein
MENHSFTKQELRIKSWLGLPSGIIALIFALAYSHEGWWAYPCILLLGWYLYTLLYWKLYQRYMLNKPYKEKGKFYGLLVSYQITLFGALLAYALQP